jgi:transposase
MDLKIPLDIPHVEILKFERNDRGEFIITVTSKLKTTKCRKCKKEISKIHGYSDTIVLRHTSLFDNAVYIRIKLTRFMCEACDDNPTTTEQPDWFKRGSQFTNAYEDYLMRMLINSTILDVARKQGLTYDEVAGSLNRQIQAEVNWDKFDEIPTLGIDEIALKKGHKDFVSVLTTRIGLETRIITILPDRKKQTIKLFLASIPDRLKKTVKTVCSDMYDGYISATKEFFGKKVKVVVDRFHVAKLYRKSVDDLRKKELRRLKKDLSDTEYKKLRGAMWALRKKEANLSDDEKVVLHHVFEHSPDLKEAYDLQNALTEIFNKAITKREAEKQIKGWMKAVRNSKLLCFDKFLVTLQNYWHEILNYFYRKERKNSGFVEGLNNKIKTIKRRCYGLLSVETLFQRVYLDLEGYRMYA